MPAPQLARPARSVVVQPECLDGLLAIPRDPLGIVIFAHGGGSSRFSPRDNQVADALHRASLATLLLDLLSRRESEDPAESASSGDAPDGPLLAHRLKAAVAWVGRQRETAHLPVGYFGASTGAGAALLAASGPDAAIAAVVSRGGRPDLAGAHALAQVRAPTLLIVGARDLPTIGPNRAAMMHLTPEKALVIVPDAGHQFEEPGTMDQVVRHSIAWFQRHLEGSRR